MHRKHFQLAMLAVTLCLNLAGQTAGAGTITGTIMDPSGAVVPAATVAVKHTATQTERTLASNEAGIFVAQFLQPGRLRDYGDEGGLRKDGADQTDTAGGPEVDGQPRAAGAIYE